MLSNSLSARIVLLVLVIVLAGQAVVGLAFVHGLQRQASVSAQAQLDLAEQVAVTRIALARAEARSLATQLARNPAMLRAQTSSLAQTAVGQLLSAVSSLGGARVMLVRANGVVVADQAASGANASVSAVAPIRKDYWRDRLATVFATGSETGFVGAGGATVMWTAVPSAFDGGLALILVQPIEAIVAAEFGRASTGVKLRFVEAIPSQLARSAVNNARTDALMQAPQGGYMRHFFLDAAQGESIAVELRIPQISSMTLLRDSLTYWLPVFMAVLLLSALAACTLCRRSLRPLERLRQAIAAQAPDNLKPLNGQFGKGPLGALAGAIDTLTEQVSARDKSLTRTAFRDPLTSLPNHVLLNMRLNQAIREARKTHRTMAFLLIEIERFDVISESFGALFADAIVAAVASRLKSTLREADNLLDVPAGREQNSALARVAANRFAIALPGCSIEQAVQVAHRISNAFQQPVAHEGQEIECAFAIGASVFPAHAEDAAGLIRAADIALRSAQRTAEPIKAFNPEQDREREFQTSMAIDLRKAMDNGSLSLHFQPKLALGTESRSMVEALMRWRHPERGIVDPREFVPFAERMGIIGRLSRWVIDQALAQVVSWRSFDVDVQIAINVSAHDIASAQFVSYVIERLHHYELPASAMTIEISESALVQHSPEMLECLQVLDRFGVKLGIDDFGSGYASLAYLRTLPVDHVKIDRRFVSQMATDRSAQLIVAAAIRLAHTLEWEAVAEGVEDAESIQMLRNLDCNYAQGFYLGKPLDADDYLAWHRHQSRRFKFDDSAGMSPASPIASSPLSSPPAPPKASASGTLIRT